MLLLKLSCHFGVIFSFPRFHGILKLRNQVIRFIGQVFNATTQHFDRSDGGIVGLDFQIDEIDQGVGMVVSGKADRRVSQELHAKQISDGMIFSV